MPTKDKHFAHTLEGITDTSQWEPLRDHLDRVSRLAAEFAEPFHAADWAALAGRWHDLGKYSKAFQDYLKTAGGAEAHLEEKPAAAGKKVDHSTKGAQLAAETQKPWGWLLAYIIAGHHTGLADAMRTDAVKRPSSLAGRLEKKVEPIPDAPPDLLASPDLRDPQLDFVTDTPADPAFQLAVFTRMLFSCLVDADFLATEEFMSPLRAADRPIPRDVFPQMQSALNEVLDAKTAAADDGVVSQRRAEVLAACRAAAETKLGLFSLTVPTGGGKTLSSLAFAIDHAIAHGKRRIIYGIPFTSIIEQTAGVFRDVFDALDEGIVLEHHSNVDPDAKHETRQSRLAAENWDAPLVVTTNVQFFESLFASRTSRCRKLHNIVNSVIILDEAQTLPVDRLRPCLAILKELVRNYGCTIVLCTATQPAIEKRESFKIGIEDACEIIPRPEKLYTAMKRVRVHQLGRLTDEELIARFTEHDSFLTIVNTRPHASKLYRELIEATGSNEGVFHLSTLMCGQHRAEKIAEIRERLQHKQPCKVISTQLIEAGVDVDFPVVYRAMTGLDSLAQAAGRCNREGRLTTGDVFVFEPTEVQLRGYLRSVAETAREIAPDHDDLLDPAAIEHYFRHHYWRQGTQHDWDKMPDHGVMDQFAWADDGKFPFNFRTAASRFRLIDDIGETVFVPYRKGEKLLEELRKNGPSRWLLRRLQRYTVTLHERVFLAMRGDLEQLHENYWALLNPSGYDDDLGLRVDRPGFVDTSDLLF